MDNTFTVVFQNQLQQYDFIDIDMVISHDQNVIPQKRISKNYDVRENKLVVDEDFLQAEAEKEIQIMVDEWNELNK